MGSKYKSIVSIGHLIGRGDYLMHLCFLHSIVPNSASYTEICNSKCFLNRKIDICSVFPQAVLFTAVICSLMMITQVM